MPKKKSEIDDFDSLSELQQQITANKIASDNFQSTVLEKLEMLVKNKKVKQ